MSGENLKPEIIKSPSELTLLSSDRELAVAAINRQIDMATSEGTATKEVELLGLQLQFAGVVMDNRKPGFDHTAMHTAETAQREYIRIAGGGVVFVSLDRTNPDVVGARYAAEERWRIAGVDPAQYEDSAVSTDVVESAWREASIAEQERQRIESLAREKEASAVSALEAFMQPQ